MLGFGPLGSAPLATVATASLLAISGTGAVATSGATVAGSSTLVVTGSGGLTASHTVAATSTLRFTGTSVLSVIASSLDADATTFVPGVGMPFFVQKGFGVTQGTGPITPAYPDPVSAGQIALMAVQTANETLSVPAGWAHVEGSPQGTGTPGAAGSVGGNLLWQRLDGTEAGTTISVGDTGNHTIARIFTFDGCTPVGQPWIINQAVGDIQAVAQTLIEIPGRTTTIPNCLAVLFAFHAIDTAAEHVVSGEVNADLSDTIGLSELNVTSGTGGGFWLGVGGKATPGTFGLTTAQFSSPTAQAHFVVALLPVPLTITGTGSLTGSSKVVGTGSGLLAITGTGALTQAGATLTGTSISTGVSGTGTLSTAVATVLQGSGLGSGPLVGSPLSTTDLLVPHGPALLGTGTATPVAITGTGALRNAGAKLAGSAGTGAMVGAGSLAVTGAKVAGAGSYSQATIFGTGSLGTSSFTLSARDVAGLTYYVSNTPGEMGNDANSGLSPLLPKLTTASLSPGTAFLTADDRALLNCGSYFASQLTVKTVGNTGGALGHQLTYGAYGTGTNPILSGANILSGMVFDQAVAGGDRYKLVGVQAGTEAWREDGTVGSGVVRNLLARGSVALVTNLHDWRYDAATTTTYVVVATGEVPGAGGITIHVSRNAKNIVPTTGGEDYITVENMICRFGYVIGGNALDWSQNSIAATGIVFNNIVQEWAFQGLRFGGTGTNSFAQRRQLRMTNCTFRNNREHGASVIYIVDSLIDGCNFQDNGRAGLQTIMNTSVLSNFRITGNAGKVPKWSTIQIPQAYDSGLYCVGNENTGGTGFIKSGNNLIRDGLADNNARAGLATDSLSNDNVFLRCISTRNVIYGLFFEGGTFSSSSGNAAYHCTLWGNLQSGFATDNGCGPFTLKNNQISGNGAGGNSNDVHIFFFTNSWAPISTGSPIRFRAQWWWDPVSMGPTLPTRVTGIPANPGEWSHDLTTGVGYAWRLDSSAFTVAYACPPWTMDYNNYTPFAQFPTNHQLMNYVDANGAILSTSSIAELRFEHPGQEVHGTQVDPLYADPANGDFRLTIPFSPSIDAGVLIPGYNDDFLGLGPDIGAIETPGFTWGPIPTPENVGPEVSGTGDVTVVWPAHTAGRIGVIAYATDNETVAVPAGWTLVVNAATGPVGSATSARMGFIWCRADAAIMAGNGGVMPNPVLLDPGNHIIAQMFTVKDAIAAGNIINITATNTAGGTTAVSAPGATTTALNCLIVVGVGNSTDSLTDQVSGWANGDFANPAITELLDANTDAGNGGGFGVAYGGRATKGAYGASTATLATASNQARISFAILPNYILDEVPGTANLSVSGAVAGTGSVTFTGSSTLKVAGHGLAGTGTNTSQAITGTGTLRNAGGSVAATVVIIGVGTGALRVLGSVAATGTYTPVAITGTGSLGAIPAVSGTASPVFTGTATLAATSKTAATGTLASAGTATLAAIPTVTASGTLRFTGTATLGATSKIAGVASPIFTGSGALALAATTAQGCLSQTGNLITLSGAQGQLDTRNAADGGSGNSVTAPNTKYNATSATWTGINDYAVVLGNGTSTGVCWHGGVLTNTLDPNVTPWDTWHSTGGILFFPPSGCIEDVKIVNYGDGIRIQDLAANFTIRRCHLVECHDDAIENDRQHSGSIDDCLIEGCFVFLSTRPGANTLPRDSSDDVMTISNSLVWQKPMNFPEGCRLASATPPCTGPFWKWAADNSGPQVVVTNSIFRIDQFPSNGDLDFPPDMGVCSGNTIVWLGGGAYPATLPPGFTVVTDVTVWNAAAAAWKATHPLVNGASLAGTGLLTSTSAGALSVAGKVAGTGSYTAVAITGAATLRQAGATSSAVGSEGFTGTGSPKVLGSVAGTGTALFGVTGSGGLGARSSVAGSGTQTAQAISGTATLGVSGALLGTGAEVLAGPASLTMAGHTLAATGVYTPLAITGTGALAQAGASLTASGVQTSAGQALLAVAGAIAGTGTNTPVAITGTGNCTADGASVTASGVQTSVGTSTLSVTTAVLASGAQTFTGTATLGVSPTVTGTGNDVLTGTGALTAPPFTVLGDATQAFRGALGARVLLDGTGELVFTGDAQVGVSAIAAWLGSQVSGTGAQTFSGDGTLEVDDWGIDAGGESGSLGQAGVAVAEPAVEGTGSTYLDLSGSLTATKASVAGSGSALIMVIDASVQLKDRSGPHYCITDANSRHRKRRTC